MTLAAVASTLLICGAQHGAQAVPVPNSNFRVEMTDPLSSSNPSTVYGGQFTDTHQAEYSRIETRNGVRFSQIASFEANLAEGKVRGYHLAATSSRTRAITTSVNLYWNPTLVVDCGGCTAGGAVPLELSVKLHGEFDTDDFPTLFSRASQMFRAHLAPQLMQNDTLTYQTSLEYKFHYVGTNLPSSFGHERTTRVNDDACPACTAEIIGGDDNFAFGFEDLELRTVLWVRPDDEINLNFTLSGSTTVSDFEAYGDWSRTADFGFRFLNDDAGRYSLNSGSGASLSGWNATSSVPEPPALALALVAVAALGVRLRRAPG